MAIKLFVSDLDGTLLNSEHHISAANKKALRDAADAGVTVTLATGRMYPSALPYARELGLDVPIITYNGAVIKSVEGKMYFSAFLRADLIQRILRYCFQQSWYVQVYSADKLYFARRTKEARAYEKAAGIKGYAVGEDGLLALTDMVPKLLVVMRDPAQTDAAVKDLTAAFGQEIFAVKSNPEYIEIVLKGVNKALSLQHLAERLGIGMEAVMAIGDSNNDLPMLTAAGHGVAMGNANQEVRQVAEHIVSSCDADGVAEAIYKYVL